MTGLYWSAMYWASFLSGSDTGSVPSISISTTSARRTDRSARWNE
jgi:hypothetical protein